MRIAKLKILQDDERDNPIKSLPVPADPVTGLKSLPAWSAQPYVRPLPSGTVFAASSEARTQGAMNDLATRGTGEERVAGLGKRRHTRQAFKAHRFCAQMARQRLPKSSNCRLASKVNVQTPQGTSAIVAAVSFIVERKAAFWSPNLSQKGNASQWSKPSRYLKVAA